MLKAYRPPIIADPRPPASSAAGTRRTDCDRLQPTGHGWPGEGDWCCWYYSHCNRLYEHSSLHSQISDCPTHRVSLQRADGVTQHQRVAVGDLVKEKFAAEDADARAMTDFFSRGPYVQAQSPEDGRAWPSRHELYDPKALPCASSSSAPTRWPKPEKPEPSLPFMAKERNAACGWTRSALNRKSGRAPQAAD